MILKQHALYAHAAEQRLKSRGWHLADGQHARLHKQWLLSEVERRRAEVERRRAVLLWQKKLRSAELLRTNRIRFAELLRTNRAHNCEVAKTFPTDVSMSTGRYNPLTKQI